VQLSFLLNGQFNLVFGNLGNIVQTVRLFAVFGLFQQLSLARHQMLPVPQ